jgi:hypothetical protein
MDGYAICKDGRGEYTQVTRSAASLSMLIRTLEVCAPKGSALMGVVINSAERSPIQRAAKFGF